LALHILSLADDAKRRARSIQSLSSEIDADVRAYAPDDAHQLVRYVSAFEVPGKPSTTFM
jgi:hypothetical protein